MTLTDTIRVLGATARVTRLITVDDVPGQWWIKDPIDHAMHRYRDRREVPLARQVNMVGAVYPPSLFDEPWWWKYRDGLDCPWCVSVHVSAWMTALEEATKRCPGPVRAVWKAATTALAVSWVVGHAESRLSADD